jgi:hypothetical protein
MMKLQFTVPGLPRPKQRPRKGMHGNFYTPRETLLYEQEVWAMALTAGARQDCLKGKLISVRLIISPGGSMQDFLHVDGDNVEKSFLDGLRPAFNDSYVSDMHWTKVMDDSAYLRAEIEEDQ